MIIWGTRGLTSTQGTGVFHCPRCGPQRPYALQAVNRWFTLYFIPIIPLGRAGEYIECRQCAATYGTEVLNYDPQAEQQAVLDNVKRILIVAVRQAGPLTDARLTGLQSALAELTGVVISPEEIRQEFQQAQAANVQMVPFVQQAGFSLSAQGKEMVLGGAYLALSDRGALSPGDEQLLGELGGALGLSRSLVGSLLQRMKQAS